MPSGGGIHSIKILVIAAMDNLSDERAEFLINDRMSFMRFLGLSLADRVPDARTILCVLKTSSGVEGRDELAKLAQ